jgi:hypothetical protein
MEIAHHHDQDVLVIPRNTELSISQRDTTFYQFDSLILLQTLINSIAIKYE